MSRIKEVRSFDSAPVEQLESEGSEVVRASGLGAVFGSVTTIGDMFTEEVAAHAFNKTIQEANVRCTFNHSFDHLLGTTGSGTVSLSVEPDGLRYYVDLPDTSIGRDVGELLRRGDLSGSSWMGYVIADRWVEPVRGDLRHRVIEEVALLEVGPVTMPAYEDSTAALRCLEKLEKLEAASLRPTLFIV